MSIAARSRWAAPCTTPPGDASPDHATIAAAAGGALGLTLRRPDEVEAGIAAGLKAAREQKRAVVLDVWLPHL